MEQAGPPVRRPRVGCRARRRCARPGRRRRRGAPHARGAGRPHRPGPRGHRARRAGGGHRRPARRGPRARAPRHRWALGILGGGDHTGRWRIASRCTVVNVLGGADLDLRQATVEAAEHAITVFSLMGGFDDRGARGRRGGRGRIRDHGRQRRPPGGAAPAAGSPPAAHPRLVADGRHRRHHGARPARPAPPRPAAAPPPPPLRPASRRPSHDPSRPARTGRIPWHAPPERCTRAADERRRHGRRGGHADDAGARQARVADPDRRAPARRARDVLVAFATATATWCASGWARSTC